MNEITPDDYSNEEDYFKDARLAKAISKALREEFKEDIENIQNLLRRIDASIKPK